MVKDRHRGFQQELETANRSPRDAGGAARYKGSWMPRMLGIFEPRKKTLDNANHN